MINFSPQIPNIILDHSNDETDLSTYQILGEDIVRTGKVRYAYIYVRIYQTLLNDIDLRLLQHQ